MRPKFGKDKGLKPIAVFEETMAIASNGSGAFGWVCEAVDVSIV